MLRLTWESLCEELDDYNCPIFDVHLQIIHSLLVCISALKLAKGENKVVSHCVFQDLFYLHVCVCKCLCVFQVYEGAHGGQTSVLDTLG